MPPCGCDSLSDMPCLEDGGGEGGWSRLLLNSRRSAETDNARQRILLVLTVAGVAVNLRRCTGELFPTVLRRRAAYSPLLSGVSRGLGAGENRVAISLIQNRRLLLSSPSVHRALAYYGLAAAKVTACHRGKYMGKI